MASADWFLAKTQRFSLCSSHKTPVDTGSALASQSKSVLRSISARCASRCSLRNNGSSILWWAGLQWCLHMDPSEVEFLAEKELVTITPNFSESRMCLISVREIEAVSTNSISCTRQFILLCFLLQLCHERILHHACMHSCPHVSRVTLGRSIHPCALRFPSGWPSISASATSAE